MKKQACFILLLFYLSTGKAQLFNTWYFGIKAGVNFTPTGPRPAPVAVNGSAMIASEGSSVYCDANGQILMYTNGQTLYNKNNQVMQNGDNLMGHQSSFQSALIVQQPGSTNMFYVFTADAVENNFANGYRYSVVDMNLDGGKGAVVQKNILLSAPSSERLSGARHANGIDVWIITNDHNSNVFRVWLLGCTGLQPAPVISVSGAVLNQYGAMNTGTIKVSPDGKYLCQTHFPDLSLNPDSILVSDFFQLFKFNNSTGIISNPIGLSTDSARYFSAEFSPNSKLLYLTKASGGQIDQFECTFPDSVSIISSQVTIRAPENLCGLQLGPDGKIYSCFFTGKLSVINKPNTKGIGCDLRYNVIDLGGNTSSLNLPNLINDYTVNVNNGFTHTILDTCNGIVQFNGFTNLGLVNWSWDFGDGNTSNIQNPVHDYVDIKQIALVKLKISTITGCGFIERSAFVVPCGLLSQIDFNANYSCDSGFARFEDLSTFYPEPPVPMLWDFGDGNNTSSVNPLHIFSTPGNFPVKLKIGNVPACIGDSMVKSLDVQVLDVHASPDQFIHEGESVQLDVTGGGVNFNWLPSSGLNDPHIRNPIASPFDNTMYVVTVTNNAGCKDIDTVFVKVEPNTDFYLPSGFTPNNDGNNDIFKPILSLQYDLVHFNIYNRWGQLAYTTSQKGKGWDGRVNGILQDTGIFIWMIEVISRDKVHIIKKGSVALIR